MKYILMVLLLTSSVFAKINVDTSYATFGKITQKIGGDLVKVTVLGSAKYDPHFIVPKPSLLTKLRRADLLIINGAGLEIGWLPPLIQSAHNPDIQVGAKGFLDLSHHVQLINIPASVSRAFGDVHAQGNPHYITDPHKVLVIAEVIKRKLSTLDSENSQAYEKNYEAFKEEWQKFLVQFDANMKTCKDKKVIQYHELFNYFLKRYNYTSFANIEPLPGISPSSKHTLEVINMMRNKNIKIILQDVYHEKKTAKFIAGKTDAKVVLLPHDVNAIKSADSLENFYESIHGAICQ